MSEILEKIKNLFKAEIEDPIGKINIICSISGFFMTYYIPKVFPMCRLPEFYLFAIIAIFYLATSSCKAVNRHKRYRELVMWVME